MDTQKNIAETLAEVLPVAKVITTLATASEPQALIEIAVPRGFDIKEIDTEKLLNNPRRTKAAAQFSDAASFIAYVNRHATDGTVTWCNFDPQTFALSFTAVIDEHAKGLAGWRQHKATFSPDMSAEWKAWKGKDRQSMQQLAFAEWIQEHEDDIAAVAGMPTSLGMHKMATEFVANEERVLKSTVRLESGGVRLTYIADPDAGTTESMRMFEKFAIGIPVFHGGSAWSVTARLKYRLNSGKVSFLYEMVRPDRVHEHAAKELIGSIRDAIGGVPLLMGSCA